MPYPIPEKPWSAEFSYFLVAVPADRAFVRALKGHFTELGSATFWGEEARDPDRFEAAERMLEAIDETWRLIEMGFPDNLLAAIDEVEPLLRDLIASQCCPTDPWGGQGYTGTYEDGNDVPQDIIDAGFATGATDYAGFDDYKCMVAHQAVKDAAAKLHKLATLYDETGLEFVGEIGWITGIITAVIGFLTVGPPLVIVGGMIAAVGVAAEIWEKVITATAPDINALGDAVLTNEDALACAIYQADGSEAAVTAFNAKVDELFSVTDALLIKNMTNSGSTIRGYYNGRYDQTSIAQELADRGFDTSNYTCTCVDPPVDTGWTLNASNDVGVLVSTHDHDPYTDGIKTNTTYVFEGRASGGAQNRVQLYASPGPAGSTLTTEATATQGSMLTGYVFNDYGVNCNDVDIDNSTTFTSIIQQTCGVTELICNVVGAQDNNPLLQLSFEFSVS